MENTRAYSILFDFWSVLLILPWRGNSNNNRNHPSNVGIVSISEILWKIREHIQFCLIFGAFFSFCPGGGTQTTTETTHRTLELYRSVKFYGKYASIFNSV